MDIWISRIHKVNSCGEPILCKYCHKPFSLGEIAVFGSLIMRNKAGVICHSETLHWHAKLPDGSSCYIEQGIASAAKHPFVETRGRKRQLLDSDGRKMRLKLLMKRANLTQQLSNLMERLSLGEDVIDRIISIGEKLENLKPQIANYGGIPASWINDSNNSLVKEETSEYSNSSEEMSEASAGASVYNKGGVQLSQLEGVGLSTLQTD